MPLLLLLLSWRIWILPCLPLIQIPIVFFCWNIAPQWYSLIPFKKLNFAVFASPTQDVKACVEWFYVRSWLRVMRVRVLVSLCWLYACSCLGFCFLFVGRRGFALPTVRKELSPGVFMFYVGKWCLMLQGSTSQLFLLPELFVFCVFFTDLLRDSTWDHNIFFHARLTTHSPFFCVLAFSRGIPYSFEAWFFPSSSPSSRVSFFMIP